LYEGFKSAAENTPVSRSSSTHDFYKNSLPGFIESCVTRYPGIPIFDYLNIRDKVSHLETDDANLMLKDLINYL